MSLNERISHVRFGWGRRWGKVVTDLLKIIMIGVYLFWCAAIRGVERG
jgi:hypothetical protein